MQVSKIETACMAVACGSWNIITPPKKSKFRKSDKLAWKLANKADVDDMKTKNIQVELKL